MSSRAQLPVLAMQFLSRLKNSAAAEHPTFEREALAGRHLPYACHLTDNVVRLRDGSLMLVISVDGLLFETADSGELDYRKSLRDAMLRAVGSSRFAVYHHIIRRRVRAELAGTFPDEFSRTLDAEWQARLETKKLYTNQLMFTLVRRPPQGQVGLIQKLLKVTQLARGEDEAAAKLVAEVRALEAAGNQLLATLTQYGPRLLSVYNTPDGPCSEPMEFLSALYNCELRPVRLPEGDLGQYLPYRRVTFGRDCIELGTTPELPKDFAAILSIKDYPAQTSPGMLDDLLRIPAEMVISQSFACVDRQPALSRMNLALRRMRASDDEALSLRSELAEAKDAVAAGRSSFGEHHLTVMVRGETPAQVNAAAAEVHASLTDLGIISVREDLGLEAAYWAQFPGNLKYIARRALVSSANFASLASGHNFPVGSASFNHWGQAVTAFETTAAGPYYFNFHQGDLGNFTIIGPSGSGKTVIVNFLLAQARRFAPRITFFDKDRGAELFIRAIGGKYDVLRPGEPSNLNPLVLPDTAENRSFLQDWVGQLVGHDKTPLTAEEVAQIKDAIDANFAAPRSYRRLSHFAELLRGAQRPHAADLYARLRPWWGEGEHAWLFDNAEDHVDLSQSVLGFDMTRVLDTPSLRTPVMMYLFRRVDERLDGTPSVIVVDEGWKALDDDIFVHRIRDWQKTIRKRNGILGFITQNAEDALASRIASAIVEQTATQIFTANPKATEADYIGGFGLTQHEYQLVRNLPDSSRCFLVKRGLESVIARLDLSGAAETLAILSGGERSVRLFDEIRKRTGDDPAAWIPELVQVT